MNGKKEIMPNIKLLQTWALLILLEVLKAEISFNILAVTYKYLVMHMAAKLPWIFSREV